MSLKEVESTELAGEELTDSAASDTHERDSPGGKILKWISIVALTYLLLASINMISGGFKWFSGGKEGAEELFAFATNPFLALLIGVLATALVQSSSTVTSVIVGLCAAQNGLPLEAAVPMIMGANIGTTITNTIVSLAHANDKTDFKRAFAAATIHDFFNLICVLIFLPLELLTGFLSKSAIWMASFFNSSSLEISKYNVLKKVTAPVSKGLQSFLESMFANSPKIGSLILILIGVLCIFLSIYFMGKILRKVMQGPAQAILNRTVGGNPVVSILAGTIVTVLVQSSSTTTSLIIPFAGKGILKLRQIYPFTLGANIGTCITALIVALAVNENFEAAITIAIVHLLFNLLGVVVDYGIKWLREVPIVMAEKMSNVAAEQKMLAVCYIVAIFFILPGICFGITKTLNPTPPKTHSVKTLPEGSDSK